MEPDLTTISTAADVFASSYTLPQIRALHRSIHAGIDDKRARLRAQVGGSYRELLGTADGIVRMRADNDAVRELLARMGTACGRGAVSDKISGAERFRRGNGERGVEVAARLRLVEECVGVMERILKGREIWGAEGVSERGERMLLGIKVFLIGRLASQGVRVEEEEEEDNEAVLESGKKRLAALRQQTARAIDRTLEAAGNGAKNNDDLLCAMCAYVLHDSAGDVDAVQKLLSVRLRAITAAANPQDGADNTQGILKAMGLLTRTLLEVQDLAPMRLQDALSTLKRQRLLTDSQLCGIEALRLDILQRWCGDDAQYYTPFLRHDDMTISQAREMLSTWADNATDALMGGLQKTLDQMADFKTVIDLRTRVLQLWIQTGGRARDFDPTETHNSLRQALMRKFLALVDEKVAKLHLVGSEVAATLLTWETGVTDSRPSLWDMNRTGPVVTSSDSDPVGSGESAMRYLKDLAARMDGHGEAVSRAVAAYEEWRAVVDDVRGVVAELRGQRWDDDFNEIEIEDEETLEGRRQTLGIEDPDQLQARVDERLHAAMDELGGRITDLWARERDSPRAGPIATYLVRVIRSVRAKPPLPPDTETPTPSGWCDGAVDEMYAALAVHTTTEPIEKFAKGPLTATGLGVYRGLWDDDGPDGAPNMPSTGVVGFIRDVEQKMNDAGVDLWSPMALGGVKRRLAKEVRRVWGEVLEKEKIKKEQEGAQKDEKGEEAKEGSEDKDGENGKEGEEATEDSQDKEAEKDDKNKETGGTDTSPEVASPKTEDTKDTNSKDTQDASPEDTNTKTQDTQYTSFDDLRTKFANDNPDDLLVQWFFDVSYLHHFTRLATPTNADDVQSLKDELLGRIGVDEDKQRRMTKAAGEYFKRTNLLFGILASRGD